MHKLTLHPIEVPDRCESRYKPTAPSNSGAIARSAIDFLSCSDLNDSRPYTARRSVAVSRAFTTPIPTQATNAATATKTELLL